MSKRKLKTKIQILSVLSILLLLTAFSGCTGSPKTVDKTVTSPAGKVSENGCVPTGTKNELELPNNAGHAIFESKGVQTFEGKELCAFENSSSDVTYIFYMGKSGGYAEMVTKDKNGNIVKRTGNTW